MILKNKLNLKFNQINKVLLLLSRSDRYKLVIVLVINTGLAFLDLLGVALIGIASAILIRGLQFQSAGNQVTRFIDYCTINIAIKLVFAFFLSN